MRFETVPAETDAAPVQTWNVKWPERRSQEQDASRLLPITISFATVKQQTRKTSKPSKNQFCKTRARNSLEHNLVRTLPLRCTWVSPSCGLTALIVSIFICMALLLYAISLFATKFQSLESKLANRVGFFESSRSANTLFQSSYDLSSTRNSLAPRKLASVEPSNLRTPQQAKSMFSLTQTVRRTIRSLGLLQSFLRNPSGKFLTANAFNTLPAYQKPLQNLSGLMQKTEQVSDSSTTVITIYHVRNERRNIAPTGTPVFVKNRRRAIPEQISHSVRSSSDAQPDRPTPPISRHGTANVLHRNALNIVGDLAPFVSSASDYIKTTKSTTPRSAGPQLPEKNASNRIAHREGPKLVRRQQNRPNSVRGPRKFSFPSGMVEIWTLKSGSSICRIYDVARLSEGQLILSKWLEKHDDTLQQQCGLKDLVYAIKPTNKNNQEVFEKDAINATGSVRVLDKMKLDLFGPIAPRHHMPHFVTDILFPLKASELLQGSGTSIKKLARIWPTSPANSPDSTKETFHDFRPSLFLRQETWEAKTSEWVQRFASFFSTPAVGYALLSEKEGQSKMSTPQKKSTPIWRFRSVLSTNMNLYESEGLFDPHGENIVLSRNGLLGTPSWNIEGILQNPCRVVVTALTRPGPRALLHLGALKKTAAAYFRKGGLTLDFRVVGFENIEFDKQVKIMQGTNVLIATHGAGNANLIFMRRGATVIEVFPFAYKAGPFNSLAQTFGLKYKPAMSAPQTSVFKECMDRNEDKDEIKQKVFRWWDDAVAMEAKSPWVHRLELEKEFGEPGKSEGMATRRCVRTQQLAFNIGAVAAMAFQSAKEQCNYKQVKSNPVSVSG